MVRLIGGVSFALAGLLVGAGCADEQPSDDSAAPAVRQDELPGRTARTQEPEAQATTQEPPGGTRTEDAQTLETTEVEDDASTTSSAPPSAAEESDPASQDSLAFLMPSNNVVCVMREDWSVCRIFERDYVPPDEEVGAGSDGECVSSDADTLILYPGNTAHWVCMNEPLLANAESDRAGDWVAGESEQVTITGQDYAVLPYGSELSLGEVSCESDNEGVRCTDNSGHGFRLATADYDVF